MKCITNAVANAAHPLASAWNSLLMTEDALREKKKGMDKEAHVELQVTPSVTLDLTQVIKWMDQALAILGGPILRWYRREDGIFTTS